MFRKIIIVLLLFILPFMVYPQYSFESTFSTSATEIFVDTFEDHEGNYICIGLQSFQPGQIYYPLVVKYNSYGDIVNQKTMSKIDTTAYFEFGFQKDNGNYVFMGTLSDSISPSKTDFTYLCETDQDLELIKEKFYKIPEPFHAHTLENYLITPDQNIIIQGRADSSLYGYNDALLLESFDMEGNLLNFNMPENWKDYHSEGDIINKPDGSGFYLIGSIVEYSFPRDWVEFDYDLNLLNHGDIEDSLGYLLTPISIERLPNDNYFMANYDGTSQPGDNGNLEIRILDQEFGIVNDTILYYDEKMSMPVHNGVDFTDESNIWVSVFERQPTFFSGTEEFDVLIFDGEMKMKGARSYGRDKRYWLYDLTATSDGGCLIVGIVPDFEGSNLRDAYVIKVMPNDILTDINEPEMDSGKDATIFPNPFSDVLQIKSADSEIKFSLYTMFGQEVFVLLTPKYRQISLQTSQLKSAIYFFTIENEKGFLQSGKIIKH